MAKIYGLFGSMTGKLADTVMSVRNGEQIARKYQPVVFNPSTPAQIAQRAKLKLMSQLSAVLARYIAIPRDGAVSSRNMFTKVNIKNVSYASDTATINVPAVQLTKSSVGFARVVAAPQQGGDLDVAISSIATLDVDRVVYVVISKGEDEKLRSVTSQVVTEQATGNSKFPHTFSNLSGEVFVLAYGIRDNNENAHAIFGELTSPTAEAVANIVVNKKLTESDITLTETSGIRAEIPVSA